MLLGCMFLIYERAILWFGRYISFLTSILCKFSFTKNLYIDCRRKALTKLFVVPGFMLSNAELLSDDDFFRKALPDQCLIVSCKCCF